MSFPTENITERTRLRIRKEMTDLHSRGPMKSRIYENVNAFCWKVKITGPEKSPYEGREHLVQIGFPTDYPDNAPLLTLKTSIFHPNIVGDTPTQNGKIGLDFLTPELWSGDFTVSDVFQRLESVMRNPDMSEELVVNEKAAVLCRKNREEYARTAKQWTEQDNTCYSNNT